MSCLCLKTQGWVNPLVHLVQYCTFALFCHCSHWNKPLCLWFHSGCRGNVLLMRAAERYAAVLMSYRLVESEAKKVVILFKPRFWFYCQFSVNLCLWMICKHVWIKASEDFVKESMRWGAICVELYIVGEATCKIIQHVFWCKALCWMRCYAHFMKLTCWYTCVSVRNIYPWCRVAGISTKKTQKTSSYSLIHLSRRFKIVTNPEIYCDSGNRVK